jgi:hypothetical protein
MVTSRRTGRDRCGRRHHTAGPCMLALICLIAHACERPDENSPPRASASTARTPQPVAQALPKRPAACALIGQREMSDILGGAVAPPQAGDGVGSTTCRYLPANENSVSPYAEVTIDWEAGEAAMMGARLAQSMMGKDLGSAVSSPLEGLGDEASMMIGGIVMVREGETVITIDLRMQADAEAKGAAIARKILSQLGGGA